MSVLTSRVGNIGVVELCNPKALHALNLDMIRSLNDVLCQWQEDTTIQATLFSGATTSKRAAFCAGGDVKSVYQAGLMNMNEGEKRQHGYGVGGVLTSDFFREEYQLNHKIATQSLTMPQISIWDGIVMGGGVGISIHGKYRVATERTLFAMPETAIGLFPDVGGMYWLSRLHPWGTYIALTGAKLNAKDVLLSGIATHYIPSTRLPDFKNTLLHDSQQQQQLHEEDGKTSSSVLNVLNEYHEEIDTNDSTLAIHRDEIHDIFENQTSITDIMAALERSPSDFGQTTLSTLRKMSPTSLRVTLEGLRRGRQLSDMAQVLRMEYRMSQGFMRTNSDFYEGIRALLIDKDQNPRWNERVTEEDVTTYFESLGERDLPFENNEH